MPARLGKPYRVLMSTDAVGGVWTYSLDLARALVLSGAEVRLAALGPVPSVAQLSAARATCGLDVTVTGLPLDWTARSANDLDEVATTLQSEALRFGADLAHLNAPAHAGTRRWRIPLVTVAHSCVATWWEAVRGGSLPPDLAWRSARTASGLRISDAIIAPSRSFGSAVAHAYGSDLPIHTVHNSSSLPPDANKPKDRIILTAGRLWDPAKNAAIIDAVAARAGLVVHAAGPLEGPIGERVALSHLSHLGTLDPDDLATWYARAALFVSMSRYEPFGLSVLEAARCGAALVLSDIPTFRELWSGAALFVPADSPRALAAALTRLSRDTPLRAGLADCARQRAQSYSARRQLTRTLFVHRLAFAAAERRYALRAA